MDKELESGCSDQGGLVGEGSLGSSVGGDKQARDRASMSSDTASWQLDPFMDQGMQQEKGRARRLF